MILTVVLLMGMVPTTVSASDIDEPLTGVTGSGWDSLGGEPDASQWDDSSGEQDSGDNPAILAENLDDADDSGLNVSPGSCEIEEIEVATPGDTFPGASLGMSGEGKPLPWAVNLQTTLLTATAPC